MKKLLAILLAVLMVMSLAACGSEKADDEKDEPKKESTTSAADVEDDVVVEEEEEELPSYDPALDIYCDLLLGDTTDIEKTLPEEVWLVAAENLEMTKEDTVAELASAFAIYEGIFLDATYEVVSEEDAAEEIADIQDYLADNSLESEIEAAYALELTWTCDADETLGVEDQTVEEKVYVIFVDGEWYVLVETYDWYVLS